MAKDVLGYKFGGEKSQLEHAIVEVKGKKRIVFCQWNIDATYKGVLKYDKK